MKEWVKATHAANGTTAVTVALYDPDSGLGVRWSVKTFAGQIRRGVTEARAGAVNAMTDLRAAMAELEDVAA